MASDDKNHGERGGHGEEQISRKDAKAISRKKAQKSQKKNHNGHDDHNEISERQSLKRFVRSTSAFLPSTFLYSERSRKEIIQAKFLDA